MSLVDKINENIPDIAQFFLGIALIIPPIIIYWLAGYINYHATLPIVHTILEVYFLLIIAYIIIISILFRKNHYLITGLLYITFFLIMFIYWYLVGEMLDPSW